jgi:type IV secretion system protein VirB9
LSALIALALFASPALAQSAMDGISGDARFLTLSNERGIASLPTSPDTVQTVLFGQGEMIRSVILSDPAAYMVIVSGRGDSLTLRPNGLSSLAMMSVRTDFRVYEIELVAGNRPDTPTVVRFASGTVQRQIPTDPRTVTQADGFAYRLSGSAELRPETISDDGSKTYILWGRHQAMPAVFALDPTGKEEMVDGYMRDGLFTIDRVHAELIFRMDHERATAQRMRKRDGDGRN